MTRSSTFARRLSEAASQRSVTPRQMSEACGINYKRICRWLSQGISRPTNRTAKDLDKLRRYLGLESVADLWSQTKEAESYAGKLRILLESPLPPEEREDLFRHIDFLWAAHEMLERLWANGPFRKATGTKHPDVDTYKEVLDWISEGDSPEKLFAEGLEWAQKKLDQRKGG